MAAKLMGYLYRAVTIAAAAAIAWTLAARFGPWIGLFVWAGIIGAACSTAAVLLKGSPMGKITWRNRLAGFLLPWGYKLGRGKLPGITVVVWSIWVLIGAASILLLSRSHGAATPANAPAAPVSHPVIAVLLFICWFIYGGFMLRQLGYIFNQFRSPSQARQTMIKATAAMVVLVAGSLALWRLGRPGMALALAGTPLAIVGGWFALYGGIILIFGRKMRWN